MNKTFAEFMEQAANAVAPVGPHYRTVPTKNPKSGSSRSLINIHTGMGPGGLPPRGRV